MTISNALTIVAAIAVPCSAIPGLPGWAVALISTVGVTCAKLASTPLKGAATKPTEGE